MHFFLSWYSLISFDSLKFGDVFENILSILSSYPTWEIYATLGIFFGQSRLALFRNIIQQNPFANSVVYHKSRFDFGASKKSLLKTGAAKVTAPVGTKNSQTVDLQKCKGFDVFRWAEKKAENWG